MDEVHHMRYKIFLKYFLIISFYVIAFLMIDRVSYCFPHIALSTLLPFSQSIVLVIALHTSHVALSPLSLFLRSITLDITYHASFDDSNSSDDLDDF